jgi:glutamate/tyrosine decarboxylase-like PLP-dependent enzyme
MMPIPERGASREEILERLRRFKEEDIVWDGGRTFSHVFLASAEARRLAEEAYTLFLWENGLDPTLFRSLVKLENQIVAMAAAHLRGDGEVVGSFTSGGTESILLAVKTARDRALAGKPGLGRTQMVLPITAHPAFHKAASYFQVEPVVVPVDTGTYKVDAESMAEAITERTVLLVGSAPSFAHGVVDPIPELGRLALERGLLLHVDACIGGFLLPWFRRLGAEVTDFDFSVPGVTSISMDFHKYAFAAKGASVVLYRNAELRRHQFFSHSGWPGYTLVNPTIQSSRSGGPLAATWAVLQHFGVEGYLREAERLMKGTERIVAVIDAIPELHLVGRPEMCLVAVGSDSLDVFRLCDAMQALGWHMYPQLKVGELRETFHLTVLPWNVDQLDAWEADLRACVAQVKESTASSQLDELRKAIHQLELEGLSTEQIEGLLGMAGLGGGGAPEGMAEINGILNELPPSVCDKVLTVFYDHLIRPEPPGGDRVSEPSS